MSQMQLSQDQLSMLMPAVAQSNIVNIDLSSSELGDAGVLIDFQYAQNRSLSSINVSDNQISDAGLMSIAAYFPDVGMKELLLSGNDFSAVGLRALTNVTIESLGLSGCGIDDAGLEIVSTMLETIQSLDISFNNITSAISLAYIPHILNANFLNFRILTH